MTICPYLFFNGDCRDALTRYGEIFGTPPELMDCSGMPAEFPVPDDRRHWIMHGHVAVGDGMVMASDNIFGTSENMAGCAVQLSYPTVAQARAIFDQLAEGGEITMEWAATFWSAGFGTLTDRFGIRWMVGSDEMPG